MQQYKIVAFIKISENYVHNYVKGPGLTRPAEQYKIVTWRVKYILEFEYIREFLV